MAEITVIVPVYNCEKYIGECIQSVIEQTYTDWNLILVNDGSTDKSGLICREYAEKDHRIRVIDKENGGGGGEARNTGVKYTDTPFLTFLDSDDCYLPEMLECLIQEQKQEDYDVVIAGYEELLEETQTIGERVCYPRRQLRGKEQVRDFFVRHYPEGLLGFPWNKLYKTSIIKENKISFPKMRRLEDGIFNVLYFQYCNSCSILDQILHRYRESRQVELRKLPYDFYDIMEIFVLQYFETLKQWGYKRADSEKSMIDYFQNDFVCCLENICLPVWKKSWKEQNEYFQKLQKKKLVSYMLEKDRKATGRYTQLVLGLYEKQRYAQMRCCIWIKRILKTKYAGLFHILKGRLN